MQALGSLSIWVRVFILGLKSDERVILAIGHPVLTFMTIVGQNLTYHIIRLFTSYI